MLGLGSFCCHSFPIVSLTSHLHLLPFVFFIKSPSSAPFLVTMNYYYELLLLLVASKTATTVQCGVCASYLQCTVSFKVSEFIIGNTGTLNITGAMNQFYFNFEAISYTHMDVLSGHFSTHCIATQCFLCFTHLALAENGHV